MSDHNLMDKIIEKYLQCWAVLLAACGRFWEKVKTRAVNTAAFLRRCAKLIVEKLKKTKDAVCACVKKAAQKAAQWLLKVRTWLKQKWDQYAKPVLQKIAAWLLRVRAWVKRKWDRYVRPVLQKIAAFALAIRDKVSPVINKVKSWFAALTAKVRQRFPARPKELPPAEEVAVAEAAEVQPAVEEIAEEAPVETKEKNLRITNPTLLKIAAVLAVIGKYVKLVVRWIWKLRSVFLSIPVLWAAVKLAMLNMARLPESVGLDIQASGEFARMITRNQAVYWPLGLTLFCLVLTLCSKKPLLPWVISIFTLVLPVLIWVLNFYA